MLAPQAAEVEKGESEDLTTIRRRGNTPALSLAGSVTSGQEFSLYASLSFPMK